jgi:tetrapyrrole methylase family protein / MazG family protein
MAKHITIVGLGSGDFSHLTMGVFQRLQKSQKVFLRTKEHPVVDGLIKEGVSFESFDAVYERYDDFEDVYNHIVNRLFEEASHHDDIVYGVPGHPMVAEKTVRLLLEQADMHNVQVDVEGGQSFLDPLFTALQIDPIEGFSFFDAVDLDPDDIPLDKHLIICQVYDAFTASEVKLALLEQLPPDYEVTIATSVGNANESIKKVPLSDMDHDAEVSNLTSVYVPPVHDGNLLNHTFTRLRKIIRQLRSPEGCPWDREQTHESLRKYMIEEAFEVVAAIEEQDDDHLAEELGDVLLQILLHAQIGEDEGYFNIQDVIHSLSEKMIRRHPHVFGSVSVENSADVTRNWEAIKKEERQTAVNSLMDSVTKGLPPLAKSHDIQKAAAKVGFDWPNSEPVWDKINEELKELQIEVEKADKIAMEDELGDVLFSVVNLARKLAIDPLVALAHANEKFIDRFKKMEQQLKDQGRDMSPLTLEEWDQLWDQVK